MLRFYFLPVLLIVAAVLLSGCATEPVYTRAQRLDAWWGCAPACLRD